VNKKLKSYDELEPVYRQSLFDRLKRKILSRVPITGAEYYLTSGRFKRYRKSRREHQVEIYSKDFFEQVGVVRQAIEWIAEHHTTLWSMEAVPHRFVGNGDGKLHLLRFSFDDLNEAVMFRLRF
jgi:hypothetical protein